MSLCSADEQAAREAAAARYVAEIERIVREHLAHHQDPRDRHRDLIVGAVDSLIAHTSGGLGTATPAALIDSLICVGSALGSCIGQVATTAKTRAGLIEFVNEGIQHGAAAARLAFGEMEGRA
jgi:hypothetical protein